MSQPCRWTHRTENDAGNGVRFDTGELFINCRAGNFDYLNFPRPRNITDHHSKKFALGVLVEDENDEPPVFAQMPKRVGQLFRAVFNSSQRAKLRIDRPIRGGGADPIFHDGRADDWHADPDQDGEKREPESEMQIEPPAHFGFIDCAGSWHNRDCVNAAKHQDRIRKVFARC